MHMPNDEDKAREIAKSDEATLVPYRSSNGKARVDEVKAIRLVELTPHDQTLFSR
jgi:hypothetical protein